MKEEQEFTIIHGKRFRIEDPHSQRIKDLTRDWEHHSSSDKLNSLLRDARHASDNKMHFEDKGVTAIHHSDGSYTLKTKN